MLIKNVKIYTGYADRPPFIGWVEISDGRFFAIGEGQTDADGLDGEGLSLIPGLIDAHTHLGIVGDSVGVESDDCNEDSEPIQPQLMALDGCNPFDRCFFEARAAGITTAAIAPGSANPIGGRIAIVKTAGDWIDEMAIAPAAAIKFALGENPKMTYHSRNEAPVTRMATASLIREALEKARRYMADLDRARSEEDADEPEYDAANEALIPLLRGEIPAHFHAHRADDIATAVRLAGEFGLSYAIVHATDGHRIAGHLASLDEHFLGAIVGPGLCDRSKPELAGLNTSTPAVLHRAGVRVALTTDHPVTPIQHLPLCGAVALRSGMNPADVLEAMTIRPAQILGIADRVGSVEVGKDADFVLLRKEPLTMEASVEAVYINGKAIE